ncbi:ABC transporter permease [uncultured Paludibaculum sp.]|uniref:ABC transporter permease n=1 Tax=uncultured Paludibaculum sp. TaxID=1765020 RepID=UPI002AABAED9|nr:ABC transporter permease [uncultured Paludibaculum sp.]
MWADSSWARFRRRLQFLLSHDERQRLLWEEMEFHIESITEDFAAQGMSEGEARAAARRKFGNMTQQSEQSRSVWLVRWLSDLAQDLRYAFRGMRRDAGFTAFVILIAGLGIGASSTVFSVVNALLLRPLPFREPARLVWISNVEWSTQVDNFKDLRAQNHSFSDLAGWGTYGVGDWQVTGAGEPERVTGVPVTQNLLPLLGVEPALGRSFTTDECKERAEAPPAVLLSHGFWQRRFASDPLVVGRKLMFNNHPVTVVGVLPASFDFAALFAPGSPVDIFVPWPLTDETNRRGNTMTMIGRLKPGTAVEGARAEFTVLAKQMETQHPERNPVAPRLMPLEKRINGRVRPALIVLGCAVGVVMLIVCANLSNLQLARLGARQRELALRAALGAGRFRLLRQMFTESIALSCCGAVLGLGLAMVGARAVAQLSGFNLPLLTSVRIDGYVLAFTLLAAVLTGVLFGLLPALHTPALKVQDTLKEGGRGMSAGRSRAWLRNGLVVSEIAFASILLVCAGLLVRSFVRVLDVNLGFEPEHTAALRVDPGSRIANLAQQNAFLDDMLQRTRAIPGIRSAGVADILPFAGDRAWQVSGKGQIYPKGQHPESYIRVVSEGYFAAAGIRLQAGREFTERDRDSNEPVVMVNQTLARTLWPGQDPVGQVMTQDGGRRVIGVVADVRHEALETAGGSEMYLPLRQTRDYRAMELVVRTMLPREALASGLRAALRPVNPNLPVRELQSLQDLVDKAGSPRRFLVLLLGGFAGFALLLASLGIYAVISYSVNQRVHEIGIRMALGASPAGLQRLILLRTFGLAALGLALGMAASRALSDALGSLLFGVTSGDAVTYAGVSALLIVVAAAAGYIPAWRASRIDPMLALRSN